MSDSDSEAPRVADSKIERALRGIVSRLYKAGKHDELTIKRVRGAAERELGLPEDYFKSHDEWKDRSKDVISDEVEKQDSQPQAPSSPPVETKQVKQKPAPKANGKPSAARGTKRATSEGEDDDEPSARPNAKKRRETPKRAVSESSALSDAPEEESEAESSFDAAARKAAQSRARNGSGTAAKDDGAEDDDDELSELSDVRDSPPAKKRKAKPQKRDSGGAAKGKSNPKAKPTKDGGARGGSPTPNEAEIKRLQAQLVKCGIRKLWHRELVAHATDSAKIAHLRQLLADAGMHGRFSEEKARQIKERRELAADLEAVQEGNRMWGQSEGEEDGKEDEDEGPKPRRRLAKGFKDLTAFISDGEETD